MVHYTDIDLTKSEGVCSSYLIGRENEMSTEVIRLTLPPKYLNCKFTFDFKCENGEKYSSNPIEYNDTGKIEYTLPRNVMRKGILIIGIRAEDETAGYMKRIFERSFVCIENSTYSEWGVPIEVVEEIVKRLNFLEERINLSDQFYNSAIEELNATVSENTDARHTHSNKDVVDSITLQTLSDVSDNTTARHTHSNKNLLDSLTADDVGIKPDWDENDDESKNYIANRTHYKTTERAVLNESWSYDSQENYWVPAASYDVVPLVEGEEYAVLYEDQNYTFTAEVLGDRIVVIGNAQIADPEYIPSTGDFPFVFAYASDGSYEANNFSALSSLQGEIVSFGIVRESTVYHPLDVDYLPESAKDAIELKHTHANKTILDNFSTSTAYPFTFLEYGGHTVPQFPINDVAPTTEGGNDYYLNWINPNVWYRFGSADSPVTSISIYQLQGVDNSVAEEYMIEFWTGSTAPTPVIFPSDVEWPDGSEPTWEANKHYQVSIVNNVGLYAETDYGEEEEP